jgi:NADH-quinone oxidoreductase subunit M
MPILPFHTWQPDAYEQSATPVTIIMSALMVKMGLFAVLRWLLPIVPDASLKYMNLVIMLSVIGIVYASCMALVQTNIKRLIAYSSIAHVGLMCAALFSFEMLGAQGAGIQMFNHGINILGMWVIVSILENKLGTQDLRKMGGIAKLAPWFMIFLLLISLANIALPLTNGFVGEFIMFNGLFTAHSKYAMVFTIVAGIGVILAAVYSLRMIQQIAYGELKSETENFSDITWNEGLVLSIISVIIILLGVYPDLISRLLVIEKI